jgi:hypothetical protein
LVLALAAPLGEAEALVTGRESKLKRLYWSEGRRPTMNGIITQESLAKYAELVERLRSLEKHKEAMRQQIIAGLTAGAEVEPGKFVPLLTDQPSKRLTWDVLTRLVGKAQAEALRARIEPTTARRLEVKQDVLARLLVPGADSVTPEGDGEGDGAGRRGGDGEAS